MSSRTDEALASARTPGRASAVRQREKHASLALEGLVVGALLLLLGFAVYGDHVLHGGLYSDDWAIADGYQHIGGDPGYWTMVESLRSSLGSRPLLTLLLPLPHAAFGLDPEGHLAIAIALGAATSLCFFLFLRSLGMELRHAVAIATLVFVFPWSDAVRFWGVAGINNLGVCFYLLGVIVAMRGLRATGLNAIVLHLAAVILYAASVLTYEVAWVAGLLSVLLYAHRAGWSAALRRWPADILAIGAAIAWSAAHTTKYIAPLEAQLNHLPQMAREAGSLIARAAVPVGGDPLVAGVGLMLVASIAVGLCLRLPVADPDRRDLRRWLLTAAAAVLGICAAYAVLVPTASVTALKPGLDNRFNILAALPIVVLAYALIMIAVTLVSRLIRVPRQWLGLVSAIAVGLVGIGYLVRTENDEARWDLAASWASQVLQAVEANSRPPSGTTVYTFGHPAQTDPGIPVFFDTWDLNGAVRLVWGDPNLRGYAVYSGASFACRRGAIRPVILPTPRGRLDIPSSERDSRKGPYWGPDRGAPYGKALFVDVPAASGELIRSRTQCESAIRRYRPGPFESG